MKYSPAIWFGGASLVASGVLAATIPQWAWTALVPFVLISLAAPFFPTWRYFLPVRARGPRNVRQVTLTFDDGPDPTTTPLLLDLLDLHGVKACFFVIGERVTAHPDLVRSVVARGHEVGNHSNTHDPILMLRSKERLALEIDDCQRALSALSICPQYFRPPVGIVNPRLGPILAKRNMTCLNFSLRPWDGGNQRITNLAKRVLRKVKPGDIILLHDCTPSRAHTVEEWLAEIAAVLVGLEEQGLLPVTLAELYS